MEYNDLIKQAEEHNKQLHRTKDINVNDCLTPRDRDAIAEIIIKRVTEEYGDLYPFHWNFECKGHFLC